MGIGHCIHRVHLLETVLPGGFDEMAHQCGPQASMLPGIGYRHGTFALTAFFGSGVTAHPYLDQFSVLVGKRDERHLVAVIDLHELLEERGTDFLDGAKEAEMAGFRRQIADELDFTFPILQPERADEDVTSVVQMLDPMLFSPRIGSGERLVSRVGRGHAAYSIAEEAVSDLRPCPGGGLTEINVETNSDRPASAD
ncbi:hypothetical protein D9M70_466570 [compost metagenome]